MKFQLVIQWLNFNATSYDAMIAIEDLLMEKMAKVNEVDGHDAGVDEFNIFIHTDDPENAFKEVRSILGSSVAWGHIRAAYREISKSDYVILWPAGLTRFKVQ